MSLQSLARSGCFNGAAGVTMAGAAAGVLRELPMRVLLHYTMTLS